MKKYKLGVLLLLIAMISATGCSTLMWWKSSDKVVAGSDSRRQRRSSKWRQASEKSDKVQLPTLRASATEDPAGMIPRALYRLRPGDPIVVYLRGIPDESQIEDVLDERARITLPYIDTVSAYGKTSSELEREIRRLYLSKKIYKDISVNVVIPAQSYFVRGEIRQPGRFPLAGGLTVVQAMAAAGGYTEFANPSKVKILRGSERIKVNVKDLERHPEKDIEIETGDVIVVPRSIF